MEDLKKKINFDPSLLYYSPNNKESEEDEKPSVTNVETYNSTNRKHVCTVCGKRFFSVSALNLHSEHHGPNERSSLEKDNDNANLNRKTTPLIWKNGTKCHRLECNFIALDAVEYSKHISSCEGKRVTKGGENISFCELCDSYFSSDNHFKAHLILQHPDCDPDISLKEYDAKHTTISDPVSLYVSENNLEDDSDVKQGKSVGHSKYSDSFISKKKTKDTDTEGFVNNKDTNPAVEEVTAIANEQSSVMSKSQNTDNTNGPSVQVDMENSSNEIVSRLNNSEMEILNDESSAKIENEKISQILESDLREKIQEVDQNNVQTENTEPLSSSEKVEIEEIANDFSAEIKGDEKPADEENSNIDALKDENVEGSESMHEQQVTEVKKEDSVARIDDEGVIEEIDPKSCEEKETTESLPKPESTDDVRQSENQSDSENKKDQAEKADHEHYMNVEKMMYNLFNDEETPDKAQASALKRGADLQIPQIDSNEKKTEGSEEIRKMLSETPKLDDTETKKDDSDFEEFDYSRAGKKKYLKSYSRLTKKKIDLNEENVRKTIKTPEKTCVLDTHTKTYKKESPKEIVKPSSQKRVKQEYREDTNKSSNELNIKERSTRMRKKLILPDYEYDSDYKSYCNSDTPSKRKETEKRPSSKGNDSVPKKRGRPRKNTIDVSMSGVDADDSISSNDISSTNISKSTTDTKEKIEHSYLNTSEASTKIFTPNDTIQSIETQEISACSQSSQSLSHDESEQDNDDSSKSEIKTETQIDQASSVIKKKRGRPRKIKKEMKCVDKKPKSSPPPTSIMDKSSEESIFSDLANALLSLGGSAGGDKLQKSVENPVPKLPQTQNVNRVAIIKRKKSKFFKPNNTDVKSKVEIPNEPTFPMKNDIEDSADTSGEVDTDLSFNNANKFEKEKVPEEQMTNFMKDISLIANVSTPKKRGRPPKLPKKFDEVSSIHGEIAASTSHPKPKLHKVARLDVKNKANKLFKSKLSDRKSVFLKKKLMKHNKIKSHLDAMSFSLLQNNAVVRKRGRPPKVLKGKIAKRKNSEEIPKTGAKPLVENHSENETEDMVVRYIQNAESLADVSNVSKKNNRTSTEETSTLKKKKGRPPKDKTASASGSGVDKKKDSVEPKKDLNLNDVRNVHKSKEDSPYVYENNYHPKKKRIRIDSKISDDDIANVKTDDIVLKKVTKVIKQKSPAPVEPKDETYAINKDLYLEDMKTRAKYGKLFKKTKSFVYDEKYTDDMKVTCGRCEKKMTFRHYKNCHVISHYYVTWIKGEPEININDDTEVIRILQAAITPEALKKKAIRFACEKCGDVRKSVVGYVSHVRFCQKEDKNDLFETCTLCGRVLRPSSVRFHYIKFHGTSKPSKNDSSLLSSQNSTLDTTQDGQEDSDDGKPDTPIVKRYRMGFTKTFLQKKDVINDEHFWTALKTSYDLYMCMGLSCKHMTLSKDDLKSHILHCSANFCEFSCSFCSYKTKYENEIIYHSKKKCQENSDDEQRTEEVSVDVERRVSTRKKKRKFQYDSANELNETSEDEKTHTDHDFGAELASDDEEYFSDIEDRRSRSKKKKTGLRSLGEISDRLGLRNAFQQYCLSRTDPLRWTVDLRLKLFSSTPLHVHMKINSKEWETVPSSEKDKYIPAHRKSMKVYFDCAPPSQFDLFQADVIKGTPTCFVGGPVWALAWAPLPAQVTEQFLAVSTLQNMNHVVEINNSITFPSLIQFWRYNSIDNISNDIQKPSLAWSIAHNFGAIWSMEWCPSGGFNNLSNTCRLGILAAATSAGCVILFNIPKLETNDISTEQKEIISNPKPDLLLKVRNENVQCTRIVWDQTAPHNSIIGGFSDGTVAFWNINTASVLLKKGSVIYPYRTFEAHNSPITALDLHWLNNSRFLLTGSTDRVTRYWDVNDLSGPMYEYERTTSVMNSTWMQHWIVTANVHDFGTLIGEAGAFIAHPRDSIEKKKTIINVRDAFWSVSYSLWNDMVAVSSNGGYVSAYAAKHLSLLTYKHPEFEKIITSTELVELNEEDKKDVDTNELVSRMPASDNLFDCTSTIRNNGIRFTDKAKSKAATETISFDIEKSGPVSVNKVCWNQNYNSFNWLAIGYECGFVRVIRVERFDKHYLTKFYKTNENTATLM